MKNAAQIEYEKTPVGCSGSIKELSELNLHTFQHDVKAVRQMQRDGLIRIDLEHRDSDTPGDYVDLVSFTRLK